MKRFLLRGPDATRRSEGLGPEGGWWNRLSSRKRHWVLARRSRQRAWRLTIVTGLAWLVFWVLKTILGRAGIVAQVLSPTGGPKMMVAIAGAAVLVLLRIGLIFFAPFLLVLTWTHALWPSNSIAIPVDRRVS